MLSTAKAQHLMVEDLVCEYTKNPIGIDVKKPRLSWKLQSNKRNVMQTAYEIKVATTEKSLQSKEQLLWGTGKVSTDQSLYVQYNGPALNSKQRYYWQVRVWDNQGKESAWSEVNYWEVGFLKPEEWAAKWIQSAEETDGKAMPSPIFNKIFKVEKELEQARLYISSHGLYEAKINGKKIGNYHLTPGWTSYHQRLQYQVYDVKDHLRNGDNITDVTVGDGWFRGNLFYSGNRNSYGKEVALIYQLELRYKDGSSKTIVSDGTWRVSYDGPVLYSDIYNGEIYDAGKENIFESNASVTWKSVKELDIDKSNLVASNGVFVTKQESIKPVKLIKTPKNEQVIDFGQNLAGWVKFSLSGKKGDTITLHHAEVLDADGNFYTENLKGAKQEIKYVFKGSGVETFEPHFTYQGFRYIRISGYNEPINLNSFSAEVAYSNINKTGTFVTSSPLLNQLQHNIVWSQKGNFVDVPTDCPQRDERLGWTADAKVFFNTSTFNMDVSGFFSKWLADLRVDQYSDGNVPHVVPDIAIRREKDPSNWKPGASTAGSAGWADAATMMPWYFFVNYADERLLSDQYESMKKWVDFIKRSSVNNLSKVSSRYGDWLFYSPKDDLYGKAAVTDRNLIAQVFYIYSTQVLANAAKQLKKDSDYQYYNDLIPKLKEAFMKEFVTANGILVSPTQTAYVLALHFDILPQEMREQAAKRLVDNIKFYNYHLTTGFLGTPYLNHVLTRFGYNDVAYKLLFQESYPSWLFQVKRGATTIWERWDGIREDGSFQNVAMNSFNHYAYGAVGDWMYKNIGGLKVDENKPGYKHFYIEPKPGDKLTSSQIEYESGYGKIKSAWELKDQTLALKVTIPPNSSATVTLPNTTLNSVRENGKAISSLKLMVAPEQVRQDVKIQLGSGDYYFTCNRVN